ncbi:MAG: citrate (Si)-synthase, partial [Myxococcales bacterium]|nr:citrate (Si)-synthase [Myxococcales bacterium]
MDMTGTARFVADVADVEMPIVEGTEHELGIDIAKLRSSTGVVTLDPGFVNTASCESAITFLNGEEGVLRYRGYPIEQLAQSGSFLETCYLLIWGELPNVEQLDDFRNLVRRHTLLHEDMKGFFRAFPHNAHPMAILSSVVSALSTFYQDSYDPDDPEQVEIQIIRLLAKLPTI